MGNSTPMVCIPCDGITHRPSSFRNFLLPSSPFKPVKKVSAMLTPRLKNDCRVSLYTQNFFFIRFFGTFSSNRDIPPTTHLGGYQAAAAYPPNVACQSSTRAEHSYPHSDGLSRSALVDEA